MATVADDALNGQSVNRMLGAGADVAQAFQQQILRANADDQRVTMSAARSFETTTQLITYVGAQALLGSDPTLAATILSQRSAGGQPQSGGGPGQPVSFPVQQQLPTAPNVYSVNPTTGAITKA
jgi:hypothetical protein